jgi:putative addiction module component (TIGR02574 family)
MVTNELIEQILALPADDREYIATLLASMSDDLPPQLNPDEQKEILRRAEEAAKHPETLVTWEQVKQKLAEQRARRTA